MGLARGWDGTQPGRLIQTDQRDIPYHVMSCSAIKPGVARWGGEVFSKVAVAQSLGRYWSVDGE